jgi:hypothetical protein
VKRFSPITVFGIFAVSIILLSGSGCNSHQAAAAAPQPFPPAATSVHGPATVAPNSASDQPGSDAALISPAVVIPQQPSPLIVRQDTPAMMTVASGNPPSPELSPAVVGHSETSRRVQVVVGRIVDRLLQLTGTEWLGLAALAAMLVLYSLEDRAPFFTLAFATACWMGLAYGVVQRSWLIGIAGGIWGCIALRKWWRRIRSENDIERPVVVWPVRVIGVLAVFAGVVLLIVDSPVAAQLPISIDRALAEAIPLLLVGIAYVAWLAIDRPPIIDLIKQIFIAAAFILWGIDLLMPRGQWARFVGAVVISIYVFDLVWLIEGNLRKRFGANLRIAANACRSPVCQSSGVCVCDGTPRNTRNNGDGRRAEVSPASGNK